MVGAGDQMPTHRQRTVDIRSTSRALNAPNLSTHDTSLMTRLFPASPIHSGDITPDSIKEFYQANVLDNAAINDEGHTFGTFDTSYSGAPNMAEVDLRGNNLPSPYVPNPVSPGPGSQNDSDKGPAPEGFGRNPTQNYGTGVGSQLSPHAAAERISGTKLGEYLSGRSSTSSDT